MDGSLRMEIESQLKPQNVVYLATVEGLQPRVRPVTLIILDTGQYVITGARGGKDAAKIRQLRNNPRLEYYLPLEDGDQRGFIRCEATATEVSDPDTKEKVFATIPWAQSYFSGPDDLDYVLLEIHSIAYSYRRPGDYIIQKCDLQIRHA